LAVETLERLARPLLVVTGFVAFRLLRLEDDVGFAIMQMIVG
jgi:hypothetical protein